MQTPKITKGVITVAGIGTRFLPATKAMPKEMLPVLDKPVLQFIVEEMVASGITEIMFITSSQKRAIEDHFDRNIEFERMLKEKGKYDRIKDLVELSEKARFYYTRQAAPLGNGHALLCAKEFIGDEPFVFSDGDSIIDGDVPVVAQLLKQFETHPSSIIGVARNEDAEFLSKKGNVFVSDTDEERLFKVEKFVEKPPISEVSPHGIFVAGMRYVFTKDIWPHLEAQGAGKGGEIWVSDAANTLAQESPFFAYEYEGQYFDTGNKAAMLEVTMHFAKKEGLL